MLEKTVEKELCDRVKNDLGGCVETFAVKIAEAERCIADKQVRYIREWAKLEQYIAAIPDSLTRQILTLRFVDGESWGRIAFEMGGNNTAESVRTRVYRCLKANR